MALEEHNYMKKILAMAPDFIAESGVYDSYIFHDDWCAKLTEGGICNCDPDVDIVKRKACALIGQR